MNHVHKKMEFQNTNNNVHFPIKCHYPLIPVQGLRFQRWAVDKDDEAIKKRYIKIISRPKCFKIKKYLKEKTTARNFMMHGCYNKLIKVFAENDV